MLAPSNAWLIRSKKDLTAGRTLWWLSSLQWGRSRSARWRMSAPSSFPKKADLGTEGATVSQNLNRKRRVSQQRIGTETFTLAWAGFCCSKLKCSDCWVWHRIWLSLSVVTFGILYFLWFYALCVVSIMNWFGTVKVAFAWISPRERGVAIFMCFWCFGVQNQMPTVSRMWWLSSRCWSTTGLDDVFYLPSHICHLVQFHICI